MVRKKIQIKKIEKTAARQATFSKRRRGLLNKASELAVLCDAQVALIIISESGNLFKYSSSSMSDILMKYNFQSNLEKLVCPSRKLQKTGLGEEIAKKMHLLRHMMGEDIQRLNIEELQQLQDVIEVGLTRVIKAKNERILDCIAALQRKHAEIMEENERLKNKMTMILNEERFDLGSISRENREKENWLDTSLRLARVYDRHKP